MNTYLLIAIATLSSIVAAEEGVPPNATDYKGSYDISAKDMGYLCSLMPEYLRTGKQPDITANPPENLSTDSYMRPGGDNCWKMRWNPCSKGELKKNKPCGWYKMQAAPASEC